MPRSSKLTRVKRGKWARYNKRRAANRALDRQLRQANRIRRHAEAEAALLAELAVAPPVAPLPSAKPPLTLRLTIEIAGEKHRMTLRWSPLFQRWSMPKCRLFDSLSALLDRAPEIAAAK
jgi:hypothetical protein